MQGTVIRLDDHVDARGAAVDSWPPDQHVRIFGAKTHQVFHAGDVWRVQQVGVGERSHGAGFHGPALELQRPVAAFVGAAGSVCRCGDVGPRQFAQPHGKRAAGIGFGHVAAIQNDVAGIAEDRAPAGNLRLAFGKRLAIQGCRAQTDFAVRAMRENVQRVYLLVFGQCLAQHRNAVAFRIQADEHGIGPQGFFDFRGITHRSVDDENLHGRALRLRCRLGDSRRRSVIMDESQPWKLGMNVAVIDMIGCFDSRCVKQEAGFQLKKRMTHGRPLWSVPDCLRTDRTSLATDRENAVTSKKHVFNVTPDSSSVAYLYIYFFICNRNFFLFLP